MSSLSDAPDPPLPCVEIEPASAARSAVIFLHGLGADGHDFEPVVPLFGLPAGAAVRFILPHAPTRPVTINGGMVMRAWYDVREVDLERRPDRTGIVEAAGLVTRLLAREVQRGIPASRIVLGGFSQGGAMALWTGLRHPERLAGILCLSAYLPLLDSLPGERSEVNRDTPLFLAHGAGDPVVPIERGLATRNRLQELGYDVAWRTYPVEHSVDLDEVRDVGAWLRDRLTAP